MKSGLTWCYGTQCCHSRCWSRHGYWARRSTKPPAWPVVPKTKKTTKDGARMPWTLSTTKTPGTTSLDRAGAAKSCARSWHGAIDGRVVLGGATIGRGCGCRCVAVWRPGGCTIVPAPQGKGAGFPPTLFRTLCEPGNGWPTTGFLICECHACLCRLGGLARL